MQGMSALRDSDWSGNQSCQNNADRQNRIEPPTDQSGAAQKRNRTGMENSAYGDSNADGGTKLDRSFAQHGGYPSEGFSG